MIYDVRYNESMEEFLDDIRAKGITSASTVEEWCEEQCEEFPWLLHDGKGWGRLMDIARSKSDSRAYLCYQSPNGYYVYQSGMGSIMYDKPLNPHAGSEFKVTGAYADLAATGDMQFMYLLGMLGSCALEDESLDPYYEEVDIAVFARADWQ